MDTDLNKVTGINMETAKQESETSKTSPEQLEKIKNRKKKTAKRTQKTGDRMATVRNTVRELQMKMSRMENEILRPTMELFKKFGEKKTAKQAEKTGDRTPSNSFDICKLLENTPNSNEQRMTNMDELNKSQHAAMMMSAQLGTQLTARLVAQRTNPSGTFTNTMPNFSKAHSDYMENSRKLNEDLLADLEKDTVKMQDEEYKKKVDEMRAIIAQGGIPDYSLFDIKSPGFIKAYSEFTERSMKMSNNMMTEMKEGSKREEDFKKALNEMCTQLASKTSFSSVKTDSKVVKEEIDKLVGYLTASLNRMKERKPGAPRLSFAEYSKMHTECTGKTWEVNDNFFANISDETKQKLKERLHSPEFSDLLKILPEWMEESRRANEETMAKTADIMKKYWERQNYSKTNESKLEEKDSEIERLRELLKAKEEEVAEEKAKFRVQEELTNGLRKWVVEKDAELMVRESQIKVKEAELEEKSKKRTLEVEDLLVEVDEKKSKEEEKETIQKLEDLELDSGDEDNASIDSKDSEGSSFDLLEDN